MGGWIFRGLLAAALFYYLLEGSKYSPHAVRLPQMVAGATLFFLIMDAILTWRQNRVAKTAPADLSHRPANNRRLESHRFYASVFCLIAFFSLFPWLGYLLSSILFVFWLSWMLGERRWYVLTACSIAVPLLFWYSATEYLKVVMPKGALFDAFFR
jgi:hypothetical protein